jgi:flagellar biosynthesis chaperone FliJ
MKTRFTSLIKVKKDAMDKCERDLRQANDSLRNAQQALEIAYNELNTATMPNSGPVSQLQQARMKLTVQRAIINEKRQWLQYAQAQAEKAREVLKTSVMEYEKFKYLEAEQMRELLKKQKKKLDNERDEIAIQTYSVRWRSE